MTATDLVSRMPAELLEKCRKALTSFEIADVVVNGDRMFGVSARIDGKPMELTYAIDGPQSEIVAVASMTGALQRVLADAEVNGMREWVGPRVPRSPRGDRSSRVPRSPRGDRS